MPKLTTRT